MDGFLEFACKYDTRYGNNNGSCANHLLISFSYKLFALIKDEKGNLRMLGVSFGDF